MGKDEGTPVKCKEIMKRQTYVKTKMKLMKARQIILKHSKKGNVRVHSVPQKEQKQSEGGDESDLSEMSSLCMQVETMIKQGKTDADSIRKINTLKNILAMLGKPEDKRKTDEKHKTKRKSSETDKDLKYDEQISSDLNKDEQISSDLKQDEKLSSDLTQDEKISGEDIKTENVTFKIQVEEPYSSDESTNDLTVKEKTDTSCVDKLVIDDNQVLDYSLPVADTGQDTEKAVAGVVGDLLDNVLVEVEEDGEELSSTPPCSQMP